MYIQYQYLAAIQIYFLYSRDHDTTVLYFFS